MSTKPRVVSGIVLAADGLCIPTKPDCLSGMICEIFPKLTSPAGLRCRVIHILSSLTTIALVESNKYF